MLVLLVVAMLGRLAAAAMTQPAQDWPTYGYTLANTRHVDFREIDSATVHQLVPAWKFRLGEYGVIEDTPIVTGDTMYVTTGHSNAVIALDAATGALRWRYQPPPLPRPAINRGVAVEDGSVFYLTLDNWLVALDASSGSVRWRVRVADPEAGYRETMAPLAWHGLVFVGCASNEVSVRGFVAAYAASTGAQRWRWWSVGPGWEGRYVQTVNGLSLHRDIASEKRLAPKYRDAWRHGGGAVWMTPALDAARRTLYFSVGNPSFRPNRSQPGDNLYTCSIVALDALTGRLRWYYQEVPHDIWDYDAASPPLLFEANDATHHLVDAVGQAGKTGWFYVLRRSDGKLIRVSQPFVVQHGMFDVPQDSGTFVAPSGGGGAVAPAAFDPALHEVYVGARSGTYFKHKVDLDWVPAGTPVTVLSAIDVDNGKIAWRHVTSTGQLGNIMDGPLSAADLVFMGQESGAAFNAYDARTGAILWTYQADPGGESEPDLAHRPFSVWLHDMLSPLKRWLLREPAPPGPQSFIQASPMAYTVAGREYIAVIADAYERYGTSPGDTVYVFALPR